MSASALKPLNRAIFGANRCHCQNSAPLGKPIPLENTDGVGDHGCKRAGVRTGSEEG
jgi:hypothetical protein